MYLQQLVLSIYTEKTGKSQLGFSSVKIKSFVEILIKDRRPGRNGQIGIHK